VAVTLLATGCVSRNGPEIDGLRVTGTERLDVARLARLSPSGDRMVRPGKTPCVSALDGSEEQCVDAGKVRTDWRFVSWSPDGEKLAFTNNLWGYEEPDLWVFDTTSGELRNLTDDGVRRIDLERPPQALRYDAFPSWTPDGEEILFARAHAPDQPVSLLSIAARGGEVTSLREIPCTFDGLRGLAWSEDHVAWTCELEQPSVMLGEHTGGRADLVATGDISQDRSLLSFSPDGKRLLVDSLYAQYSSLWEGEPLIVAVDDGAVEWVGGPGVGYPTWSPTEDHTLAFVTRPGTVWVADEPDGRSRALYNAEKIDGPDGLRLSWAKNTMLVIADDQPVLLTLAD
jgi:dipeptidyl aminopeptidase/acylaminoacyl peptidase